MDATDNIRNNIIDKLLTISNREYLLALYHILENSGVDNDTLRLTKEQFTMLELSEQDIKFGRFNSQEQLDKDDLEWLKGQ